VGQLVDEAINEQLLLAQVGNGNTPGDNTDACHLPSSNLQLLMLG
jgi:hypothetical protein